jgi:release factor glutamine methyltransferase
VRREPVAYILRRKGFRRMELIVDPRVLIPRPETELLVEVALERAPATVLDVGTGSGAIALAIADELPGCEVTATDTAPRALEVARANAQRLGLSDRVRFLDGSIPPQREFDLVLANLPYVAEADWASLQPEVTRWEPREALLAGADGLDAIRAFVLDLERISSRGAGASGFAAKGAVALEVGEGQAGAVAKLLDEAGFSSIEARADLAGIERVVLGER